MVAEQILNYAVLLAPQWGQNVAVCAKRVPQYLQGITTTSRITSRVRPLVSLSPNIEPKIEPQPQPNIASFTPTGNFEQVHVFGLTGLLEPLARCRRLG